ncbi:hypothetical protein BO78DRAFT_212905 [Aspergillus sclerotiicarbonarius CBS 121057]|uniref:Uncharacterized protein n=1 Tax=Aspergillus sclerotiicarbonarius (strain CBS 121057 / IBT 28362) TaxID=1448318 RepID=A0A319DYS9_ASPSB|nr:hypothetical protein BO78DRAFT_212905 [Aspergillus sclerotiicarbonarius CBS 121057]
MARLRPQCLPRRLTWDHAVKISVQGHPLGRRRATRRVGHPVIRRLSGSSPQTPSRRKRAGTEGESLAWAGRPDARGPRNAAAGLPVLPYGPSLSPAPIGPARDPGPPRDHLISLSGKSRQPFASGNDTSRRADVVSGRRSCGLPWFDFSFPFLSFFFFFSLPRISVVLLFAP